MKKVMVNFGLLQESQARDCVATASKRFPTVEFEAVLIQSCWAVRADAEQDGEVQQFCAGFWYAIKTYADR